ncbi:MAG TPA: serine hydrolase domain-containing protein, partial [Chthoniobacteraceae bacterium]|nr:serine hydrolase domain-containing protein [Chthoniobacteraceae bacterium]
MDDLIASLLGKREFSGLSLAIIDGGKIVKARGYGFTDKGGSKPVTPDTLFQAGSVSKSLAALGALHLVEAGKLSLDADVNTELRSWKLPDNEFTRDKKVTLRLILSHSAGITVHGFAGYAAGAPVPTLLEVLDGARPANSAPIRVDTVPGTAWRYSGGGYTVMQQMMIDASGKPFAEYMRDTVLAPLGMTASTFEQPLPEKMAALAATGC